MRHRGAAQKPPCDDECDARNGSPWRACRSPKPGQTGAHRNARSCQKDPWSTYRPLHVRGGRLSGRTPPCDRDKDARDGENRAEPQRPHQPPGRGEPDRERQAEQQRHRTESNRRQVPHICCSSDPAGPSHRSTAPPCECITRPSHCHEGARLREARGNGEERRWGRVAAASGNRIDESPRVAEPSHENETTDRPRHEHRDTDGSFL